MMRTDGSTQKVRRKFEQKVAKGTKGIGILVLEVWRLPRSGHSTRLLNGKDT
jgi:hypothetical protein